MVPVLVTAAIRATSRMSWGGHSRTAAARLSALHQRGGCLLFWFFVGYREPLWCLDIGSTGKVESVGGLPERITACLLDVDVARPFPPLCGVHRSAAWRPELPEAGTSYPVPPGKRGSGRRLERR